LYFPLLSITPDFALFPRPFMTTRQATISRKTSETEIEVFIDLDCVPSANVKQMIDVSTGIGFLDHV